MYGYEFQHDGLRTGFEHFCIIYFTSPSILSEASRLCASMTSIYSCFDVQFAFKEVSVYLRNYAANLTPFIFICTDIEMFSIDRQMCLLRYVNGKN